MIIKAYDSLPEESKYIRIKVFMEEQGFQDEFDSIDDIATHLVCFDGDKPAATGRFFIDPERNEYLIGRLAVLKEYRGKGLGGDIIKEAEKLVKQRGGDHICLHSQKQAEPFYQKQGYVSFGDIDYDEDCPHIWMKKEL